MSDFFEVVDPSEPVVHGPHEDLFVVTVKNDHTISIDLNFLPDEREQEEVLRDMGTILVNLGSQLIHRSSAKLADDGES